MDHGYPIPVEDTFPHELLDLLGEPCVHECRLRSNLRDQSVPLLLVCAFLEEHLGRLREDDADEELDDLAAEIRGGGMQEVLIDVREHARTCAEVVKCPLETLWVGTVLRGGDGGMCRGYLENDTCFLVRDGRLRR